MRLLLAALALSACGPMYQQPAAPPTADPEPVASPAPAPASAVEPPPSPEAAMPEEATPAAKSTKAGSVAEQWIAAHNAVRAKHCAPALTWSKKLAEVAQSWANQLKAKGCVFGHSPGAKYGENLAAGTIGALDPESTVAMWYDEIKQYKFPAGGFSMNTGHFTQVVWKSTREVGCGHVQCKGNDIYVCNYDPPGNWEGQYRAEVLPASCKK
ncbi:MAG: hypothetical protein HOV81_31930 [Kofleriaceae bacterium]|nr:hypothetical protein [Kofleriaceae bacterium]